MTAAPKISVAMGTCNGEAFLQEQLESIAAQTTPPHELVVTDDASKDRTLEILGSFKRSCKFPVQVIVNESRLGVCRNFESAIRYCSGDIIFLADQDDVWLPSKIAKMLTVFDVHPQCGYVFCNADLIDEQGRSLGRDLWTSIDFNRSQQLQYARGEQLQVMLRRITLPYGLTMAFRSIFKPKLMPFVCRRQSTVHDGWISLLLTSIGAYGVAVPDSLVKYRQHQKQVASAGEPLTFGDLLNIKKSATNEVNLEFAKVLEQLAERLQELEPSSEVVHRAKEQLLDKARHSRARVHANSTHGWERFKTVFREGLSGRYGTYSRSIKSMVKDLITD